MSLIGNVIWIIFGGLCACLGYIWGGLVLCCTIVGIPWGLQCFKIGIATLAPFGKTVRPTGNAIPGLSCLLNLIWLVFAGLWIALMHLIFGILLCITIIGIPFGIQHFKLMQLSISPFGYDLI
jgi:uncharacterized membrane protein YccF (DUF307 family)